MGYMGGEHEVKAKRSMVFNGDLISDDGTLLLVHGKKYGILRMNRKIIEVQSEIMGMSVIVDRKTCVKDKLAEYVLDGGYFH